MEKKFLDWHVLKKCIDLKPCSLLYREQEVWWCSIGLNIGREEDGKNELFHRPVIIMKKFNSELLCVLPVSSKKKNGIYYSSFQLFNREQTALVSQLRVVSSKRLLRRIGKLSDKQFNVLLDSVHRLYIKRIPSSWQQMKGSSGA